MNLRFRFWHRSLCFPADAGGGSSADSVSAVAPTGSRLDARKSVRADDSNEALESLKKERGSATRSSSDAADDLT